MKLTGNRMRLRNQRAEKNTDWRRLLARAGALALFVQLAMPSLEAASVPGTWKVIPGIATNQSGFPVGQPIAVISANHLAGRVCDDWTLGWRNLDRHTSSR